MVAGDQNTQSLVGKEKKRMQNRIAQQNYRKRMKARSDSLQALLDAQGKQNAQVHANQNPSPPDTVTASTSRLSDNNGLDTATQGSPSIAFDFFDVDINSPPHDHGGNDVQQSSVHPHSLNLEAIIPPHSWNVASRSQAVHEPHNPPLPIMSQAEPYQANASFSKPTCTRTLHPMKGNTDRRPDGQRDPHSEGEQIQLPPEETPVSIEERVSKVTERAIAVGFSSFDEAVVQYYTARFDSASPLCHDQRLSRNRRLPLLMSTLHRSSKDWSEWERRGFQEQMTLGAEDVLVSEVDSFMVQCSEPPLQAPPATVVNRARCQKSPQPRLEVQNSLPNLWALATSLLAKSGASNPEARSEVALAVIETLCFGRDDTAG
ncbi:hypothetical protein B9Z65_5122 [Elsinoe australis]|uniref:BZIP domain-containing protein n=1 Tax=Elsinoe australis TaxID=40998 RepID=A0A2P7ZD58_9PEZI|nr:hypothetical protein B9Z65_5122 [Elsinoe australis]